MVGRRLAQRVAVQSYILTDIFFYYIFFFSFPQVVSTFATLGLAIGLDYWGKLFLPTSLQSKSAYFFRYGKIDLRYYRRIAHPCDQPPENADHTCL